MKTTTRLQASLSLDPLASVVSIAGTDPSGGAGIQADIKAISATGCYAASESLFSRKILAILSPKLVRITRLKVGPDSSCVRHALAHSRHAYRGLFDSHCFCNALLSHRQYH
jgi:hypothetical protein